MHHGIKGQLSRAVSTRTWPPACGAAADPRVATLSCCHLSNQFWHVPWMLKRTSLCFWQLLEAPGYRSDLIEVTSGASFLTKEVHTRTGTKLAHRALQLLHFAWSMEWLLFENPWSSKIMFLPAWKSLQSCEQVVLVSCDSCAYGSVHLKSLKSFWCVWTEVQHTPLWCAGFNEHGLV